MSRISRYVAALSVTLPLVLSGCLWSYTSKEAVQEFETRPRPFSVTVYPVNVVQGGTLVHDGDLARSVVDVLLNEGLANAVVGTDIATIPVHWGHNQAKMAERSAKAFAAAVLEDSLRTDYALLVEVLCNGSETRVAGVHYFLADGAGRLADGGLSNSHWEEFKEVQPTDRRGGCEVALRMLRKAWAR